METVLMLLSTVKKSVPLFIALILCRMNIEVETNSLEPFEMLRGAAP